jgi:glucose-6-phosphate 1-epimerase
MPRLSILADRLSLATCAKMFHNEPITYLSKVCGMGTIEELNAHFGLDSPAGVAEIIAGNGGLPAVTVKTKSGAEGTVYLHGAHVAAWKPEGLAGGEDVLWLSTKSTWLPDKPIRGGVPICFPWFGPKKDDPHAPAHGFARLRTWNLESIEAQGSAIVVTLALQSDEHTKKLWPFDFLLRHRVSFGEALSLSLELTNTGTAALTAEEALHTYFSVGDIQPLTITGLDGVRYLDKVDGAQEKIQDGDITITAETDRVYLDTTATTTINDPLKQRKITIAKEHSHATVVWNPWIAKAKAMADFGDDEWPHMLCVETCNVGKSQVTVEPGHTHIMTATIQVDPL